MNRIITIGREFGSGGRTIAKMTGEKLQIPVYDNELITNIAKESGFSEDYIFEKSENTTIGQIIAKSLSGFGEHTETAEDFLWQVQRETILKIAEKNPCIIVGRCADFILKGKVDLLKVFVYADLNKKADRIVSMYGEVEGKNPIHRLKEKDKRRSAFYYYHTDMKWGDPHNYHLCLDSGTLGLDRCAKVISSLY